ncbi:MAG: hypothetical protein IKA80_10175 [Spirochaetaceae bacterium]|nr:hypothetical protein [Spirochaetaceae bacterium]
MKEKKDGRQEVVSHMVEVESCNRLSRNQGKNRREEERCILVDGQWEGLKRTKGRLRDMAKEVLSGKETAEGRPWMS